MSRNLTSVFSLTIARSRFILVLTIVGKRSLRSRILLGFIGFIRSLISHPSGSVLLPFLEPASGLGEDGSSGGRRNIAKLRKLVPVDLPRRSILDTDTLRLGHTFSHLPRAFACTSIPAGGALLGLG